MKKIISLLLCAIMCISVLSGCSESVEKQLATSWHSSESLNSTVTFTLYDDGTCKIGSKYGTGHWSVVNGNVLKLTDFYGSEETLKFDEVKDGIIYVDGKARFYSTEYLKRTQNQG